MTTAFEDFVKHATQSILDLNHTVAELQQQNKVLRSAIEYILSQPRLDKFEATQNYEIRLIHDELRSSFKQAVKKCQPL